VDASVRRALDAARAGRDAFLAALTAMIRFRSVSGDPECAGQLRACAAWLASHLARAGLEEVEVAPTGGPPAVVAAWRHAPGRPTLLLYGHYDVQPAGPRAAWRHPPFHATVHDGHVYGRGASDDKGQLLAQVAAVRAWLTAYGRLPVNVVCLYDGEEEVGSPHLAGLLARRGRALAADAAVVSDTRMPAPGRPALIYGLRGVLRAELEVRGGRTGLHSGAFGGAVRDPSQVLAGLLAGLVDGRGRIRVAGLYERARPVADAERLALRRDGPDTAAMRRAAGVEQTWGEPGWTPYERTVIRPALTVSRLAAGAQGPGGDAMIPVSARAVLDLRLVPDQDPAEVAGQLERHLTRALPAAVRVVVRTRSAVPPVIVDPANAAVRAATIALRQAFGMPPVLLRSGGTIAAVGLLQNRLGVPVVLMGFALPTDRIHAPNERAHLPTLHRGIDSYVRFMHEAARLVPPASPSPHVRSPRQARRKPGLPHTP
jgi:acetylornithine deacetylase/succinyl-diaminopimelate desuccinylase-like protein